MSKRIVIIGGGVIGLATAWYCQRRGHEVTVIDRLPECRGGCSFGNAGMIVPSHFVPLAAPGMIRLGLKWMWNPESPFYIRPRASWELLSWLWKFRRACSARHVAQAAPLLRDLHLTSRRNFQLLQSELQGGVGLQQNGLLMLCRSERALHEEAETARLANSLGVPAEVLDAASTAQLDPAIRMDVAGAVYYPRDCHLSPNLLMDQLQDGLDQHGATFLWQTDCTGFVTDTDRIDAVQTSAGEVEADEFIIAGGVWSAALGRQLGLSLPMQAGKGYSVTLEQPRQLPAICSILTEARVAVTPMGSSLRFGGTMEIAGLDEHITRSRVQGIVRSIPQYFPEFREQDFAQLQPWVGLRPCSPDGLPYLGRCERWKNVVISTGHAMMGISLAMVSGQIASEAVDGARHEIEHLELLAPERYS